MAVGPPSVAVAVALALAVGVIPAVLDGLGVVVGVPSVGVKLLVAVGVDVAVGAVPVGVGLVVTMGVDVLVTSGNVVTVAVGVASGVIPQSMISVSTQATLLVNSSDLMYMQLRKMLPAGAPACTRMTMSFLTKVEVS